VISRPLLGDVPTIDLVVGYSKTNTSPILKLFLSRIDDLIARVSKKTLWKPGCHAGSAANCKIVVRKQRPEKKKAVAS